MIRRPPRSTQSRSSAASDVYKRQILGTLLLKEVVEDRVVVLVVLVEQTFQIFLRIFLEILEAEEDQEAIEAPIIEVLI